MFSATGILISAASGPIGDWIARTKPALGKIEYTRRRRLSDKAHAKKICKVFKLLDKLYHEFNQELHDMWNAYAKAPGISGYDAFMSQGLTAMSKGYYAPDLPGEGAGKTPYPLMPGVLYPPPPEIVPALDAKSLVGSARLDTRTDVYGRLQYRYSHSFTDPQDPDPPGVEAVILGFWCDEQEKFLLEIREELPLEVDTGWVSTNTPELLTDPRCVANFKYFLLHQELELPLNKPAAIPLRPGFQDENARAFKAWIIDLRGKKPRLLAAPQSIYGQVLWSISKIITRPPYYWYRFLFIVNLMARPNYQRSAGKIHIRAIFDKINRKWCLNLRGSLKTIIRDHPDPRFPGSKTMFNVGARVSNPHTMNMRINLTYGPDSIVARPPRGKYMIFDTAKVPVWKR